MNDIASHLRKFLLWLLVLALFGTAAELAITGHYEGLAQKAPLAVIALCLVAAGWLAAAGSKASLAAFRAVMVISMLSGIVGIGLHYKGKVEFQLETNRSLAGWELFIKAMKAKNPPILAPGIMVQVGLLGLIYAYRYSTRGQT